MILLLLCTVVFGQMSPSQTPSYGNVAGIVFYSDGKTPLPINNTAGYFVGLFDNTNGKWLNNTGMTNSAGYYSFTNVPANNDSDAISVEYNSVVVGSNSGFSITPNTTKIMNVTTSRTPTNYIINFS